MVLSSRSSAPLAAMAESKSPRILAPSDTTTASISNPLSIVPMQEKQITATTAPENTAKLYESQLKQQQLQNANQRAQIHHLMTCNSRLENEISTLKSRSAYLEFELQQYRTTSQHREVLQSLQMEVFKWIGYYDTQSQQIRSLKSALETENQSSEERERKILKLQSVVDCFVGIVNSFVGGKSPDVGDYLAQNQILRCELEDLKLALFVAEQAGSLPLN